jgi:hypothetical protein
VLLPSLWAAEQRRIFVYAPFETPARSWLDVSCDGEVVAKLKRGTFFALTVPSGRHVLDIGAKGVPAVVDVAADEDLFVRLDWSYYRDRPPVPVLGVVDSDQARKEMIAVRYVDVDKVVSDSVAKADPREPSKLQRRDREP